jgi:MerR family copper efflux transcriptional regulator
MDGAQPALAELPIACTLGLDDGAGRMQRWRALSAQGHPSARRDADRLIVRYRNEQGVREELDALAAAERQCCSFADWKVAQEGGHVVLRIASSPDGIAALAELFGVVNGS